MTWASEILIGLGAAFEDVRLDAPGAQRQEVGGAEDEHLFKGIFASALGALRSVGVLPVAHAMKIVKIGVRCHMLTEASRVNAAASDLTRFRKGAFSQNLGFAREQNMRCGTLSENSNGRRDSGNC